jgi:hypothetical protein
MWQVFDRCGKFLIRCDTNTCHIYQKLVTSITYLSHLSKTCHIYQILVTSIKNLSHLSKTFHIYQKLVTSIKNLSHLSKACHIYQKLVTKFFLWVEENIVRRSVVSIDQYFKIQILSFRTHIMHLTIIKWGFHS